jgi:dephospho-CoA kinase
MLKVGITGGIGSGKSVICRVFATLGVPVFNADTSARYLMENDSALIKSVFELLGPGVYTGGMLDRERIAAIVFADPEKLQQLNALVHPVTIQFGKDWVSRQTAPYIIKEAALFFESGSDTEMDVMVGVSAPLALRIARAMKRSNISREKADSIIASQMDDDEKMKRCDHVIFNDDVHALLPQVLRLHERFLRNVK